ncbi:hypothetical protein EDB89DRAFT_1972556 [Lactarius sanguifluus]|nr:hypothetical protein EDB89DRAFT_1972556 [Lactarius sanguifluus]
MYIGYITRLNVVHRARPPASVPLPTSNSRLAQTYTTAVCRRCPWQPPRRLPPGIRVQESRGAQMQLRRSHLGSGSHAGTTRHAACAIEVAYGSPLVSRNTWVATASGASAAVPPSSSKHGSRSGVDIAGLPVLRDLQSVRSRAAIVCSVYEGEGGCVKHRLFGGVARHGDAAEDGELQLIWARKKSVSENGSTMSVRIKSYRACTKCMAFWRRSTHPPRSSMVSRLPCDQDGFDGKIVDDDCNRARRLGGPAASHLSWSQHSAWSMSGSRLQTSTLPSGAAEPS